MKTLVAFIAAVVVAVTVAHASAKPLPAAEFFDMNRLDGAAEEAVRRHVETQARIIFGEYFLRVEFAEIIFNQERPGTLKLPGHALKKGTWEISSPTRMIVIFYRPLPLPRDPMPVNEVKARLAQPFMWPDGRTAQMRFGNNKSMSERELQELNESAQASTAADESKIGLIPGVILLTVNPSRRSI